MKQYLYRLSIILLVLVLLTLTGCGNTDPFAETTRLVIRADPGLFDHYLMGPAVSEFKRRYPEVDVVYEPVENTEEGRDAFRTNLKVELMAGSGADVVVFMYNTFDDLHKVLEADAFFDLNTYPDLDDTLRREDCFTEVLDGGVYKGERLYVPLNFAASFLCADTAAMQTLGITLPEHPTFAQWSAEVLRYISTHPQDEVERCLKDWWQTPELLYLFSGLQIVDYASREIVLDEAQLRLYADTCKALYPYCSELRWKDSIYYRTGYLPQYDATLVNGSQLFEMKTDICDIGIWLKNPNQIERVPDRMFSFPTFDGTHTVAVADACAAVSAGAKNKLNAYRFIQVALSVEANNTISIINRVVKAGNIDATVPVISALDGVQVEGYENILPLDYYENYSNAVMKMVFDALEPYYQDAKAFEDCVADLRNTLELYLYE